MLTTNIKITHIKKLTNKFVLCSKWHGWTSFFDVFEENSGTTSQIFDNYEKATKCFQEEFNRVLGDGCVTLYYVTKELDIEIFSPISLSSEKEYKCCGKYLIEVPHPGKKEEVHNVYSCSGHHLGVIDGILFRFDKDYHETTDKKHVVEILMRTEYGRGILMYL